MSLCTELVTVYVVFQYLVVMMGIFAVLAWIGSLIDNLLLTYLLGKLYYYIPTLIVLY